jgi:putative endonuclease
MLTWALYERHLQDIGPTTGPNIPRRLVNCTMAWKRSYQRISETRLHMLIFNRSARKIWWTRVIHCDKEGAIVLRQEMVGARPEQSRDSTDYKIMSWFVYILRCSDNSLYCGTTTDLDRRIEAHNSGTGARYTRPRLPVQLVWHVQAASKSGAFKEEFRIKRLQKGEKELLVASQTG